MFSNAENEIKICRWTKEEDDLLAKAVEVNSGRNWKKISESVSGRNATQCAQRWARLNPKRIKGVWNLEEDSRLLELIKIYGKNWSQVAEHMQGRSAKQIRDRYINKLDPNLNRTRWAAEEDETLMQLYLQFGTSWTAIAKQLPGRSENMVKNRFYSTLRKNLPQKQEKHSLVGELYNQIYRLEEMLGDTRTQVKQLEMTLPTNLLNQL